MCNRLEEVVYNNTYSLGELIADAAQCCHALPKCPNAPLRDPPTAMPMMVEEHTKQIQSHQCEDQDQHKFKLSNVTHKHISTSTERSANTQAAFAQVRLPLTTWYQNNDATELQ
eukprot:4115824-Amphidinium_carterae.1